MKHFILAAAMVAFGSVAIAADAPATKPAPMDAKTGAAVTAEPEHAVDATAPEHKGDHKKEAKKKAKKTN